MKLHFGIDYGSKLAGTTAICYNQDNQLFLLNSEKKKSADQFIAQAIKALNPSAIYIDAPLSIPAAYFGSGDNFHYRKCDRETLAMSPMFLGGLTARAMSLRNEFQQLKFHECYPSYFIREVIDAKNYYNKKEGIPNNQILNLIQDQTNFHIPELESYHQLDAVICWVSGMRHIKNEHLVLGDENEGLIIV